MDSLLQSGTQNIEPNYYDVLGCHPNSSLEQIVCEFKVRALVDHPDKNGNDSKANERFQLLVEAKETLTDAKKRVQYDSWLNGMGMGMSWTEWSAFTTKNKPVFHWVFKKPEPMIAADQAESVQVPQSNSGSQHGLRMFRAKSTASRSNDLISKFRSYDI